MVVYRRPDKRTTVADAVMLQRRLEAIAEQDERRTGRYIRPIVLFGRAERRGTDDAETYQKLKDKLVEGGIPEEQIAIRTGDVDELRGADLMDRACPIRFIITVEALAEGWDCPFALRAGHGGEQELAGERRADRGARAAAAPRDARRRPQPEHSLRAHGVLRLRPDAAAGSWTA